MTIQVSMANLNMATLEATSHGKANTNTNRSHELTTAILLISLVCLGAGLWLPGTGDIPVSSLIWTIGTLPVLFTLAIQIIQSLRRGDVGLDITAALSMSAALLLGESLAANVVAIMYAGGQFLESFADRRAGREMSALLERVPHNAMRYSSKGLEEVGVETLIPGDRIVVRSGEVVPVDGTLQSDALLDYASLTGEALPVKAQNGLQVLSGAGNVGRPFTMIASHTAQESTYAGVVRLVERAKLSKAPITRMSDRYALAFLLATVALAGASWALANDPVRGLSVLVVATPCPLILAVPVAIVAGLSRAARIGVLVKGGAILELMADIRTIVFDKTGTLTGGTPRLVVTKATGPLPEDEALRLAASLDQGSTHPIAKALVAEAKSRRLALTPPNDVIETPGEGLMGKVEGRTVTVGGLDYVRKHARSDKLMTTTGAEMVLSALAIDGEVVAVFGLADMPRDGISSLLDSLRRMDIQRIILASGDRQAVVDAIARDLAIDVVMGDLDPDAKVAIVRAEAKHGAVMMVGDGINDAPALAAANVGVAMGAKGAAASSETADVIILRDSLDAIVPALLIARRSRRIALQSIAIGLTLSGSGMVAAAFGYLSPVNGALAQEAIDILVILNALRVLF
jgi:heavy metal translocating P-type ATPase